MPPINAGARRSSPTTSAACYCCHAGGTAKRLADRPKTAIMHGDEAGGADSPHKPRPKTGMLGGILGGGDADDGQLLGTDMRQASGLQGVMVQPQKSFSQQLKKVGTLARP